MQKRSTDSRYTGLIGGAEPPLRSLDNRRHILNVAMFDDTIFSYSSG